VLIFVFHPFLSAQQRVVSLLALCGVASAFVTPNNVPTKRMTPRMAVADLIGVDVETGGKSKSEKMITCLTERSCSRSLRHELYGAWWCITDKPFDPLGIAKTPESFYKNRAIELKHGRVAMLGT